MGIKLLMFGSGQNNSKPSWVEKLFKNYMVWLDNHVRILMSLNTSLCNEYQFGLVGTVGGGLLVMECMFLVIQVII